MSRDGYYGFAEPLDFRSVVELVEFYKMNSLQPYSAKLDITLKDPVSKYMYDEDVQEERREQVCVCGGVVCINKSTWSCTGCVSH